MNLDKKISKFKLILTSFCCLLGLSCFCSAGTVVYTGHTDWSFLSSNTLYSNYAILFNFPVPNKDFNTFADYTISIDFSNFSKSNADIMLQSLRTGYLVGHGINGFSKNSNVSGYALSLSNHGFSYFSTDLISSNSGIVISSLPSGVRNSIVYADLSFYGSSQSDITSTWGCSSDNPCNISFDWSVSISGDKIPGGGDCPSCPTCPSQYTSLECQQEYSLIPISSVDSTYCESNNLCSSSDCPIDTGNVNWSALYINNIQHLGGAIIRIDIPEEISWDYTQGTGEFDLNIDGYNVDYEKMNQVLSVQNYKPTSEDFTQVIGVLAPYMQVLVFILFAFIVIKRLKNLFKSKF